MATHTVYGCYKASDGSVEFDDTATDCTWNTITGCYVKSGANAGKIKITHDYMGCSTQYYACYDPATGKFEYEADDDCCVETIADTDDCCGDDCSVKPRYLKAAFAGISDCGTDNTGVEPCTTILNGNEFTCEHTVGCTWRLNFVSDSDNWRINVYIRGGDATPGMEVEAYSRTWSPTERCFDGDDTVSGTGCEACTDLPTVISNEATCNGSTWETEGEGGTATVSLG